MNIKSRIKELLTEKYGPFETDLEHEYEMVLTENLISGKLNTKKEWITYNQVILELKNSLKDTLRVKQLQYMLTDNLDPKNVCIEVIEDVKHNTKELERLYEKISNFY